MLIFKFDQNCPVLAMIYPFLLHNRDVFRTAASYYVTGTFSLKTFLVFIVVEKTDSVNIPC